MRTSFVAGLRLSSIIACALAAAPVFAQESSTSLQTIAPPGPLVASQPSPPASAATPQAFAANAQALGGLQEIVVTANKRSQNLDDVGLTITAASGAQLSQLGIRDTGDLAKITPGLQFAKSQDGTPVFTLRGVGFNDYTLGASPAVSVYVDQVPMAYSVFTKGATLDLERVEVIKGPQGLLFGQNSTGGAINYIANKPTDTLQGGVDLSYSRFDTFDGDAYISGPVGDTLGVRVAVATTQSGPWQKSVTRDASLGRQHFYQGRLQFDWKPTDRLSFLLSVNGWKDDGDTQAAQLIGIDLQQTSSAANPTVVADRIAAFENYPLSDQNPRSADWDDDRSLKHDDSFLQTSLRADYKVTDDISLTSVSAYSHYVEHMGIDRDGTTLHNAGVNDNGRVDSYYQELRLSGKTDRFNWLLGANYAQNKTLSANDILTGDSTNTALLPGGPFIARSTTTITQNTRDSAVYGNVEFKVTDQLTLLGGARYTESKNRYSSCMRGDEGMQATFGYFSKLLGGTTNGPVTSQSCLNLDATTFQMIQTPFHDQLNQHNVSWRGGINFKPSQNILFYGLISRGYKSGSFPTVPASTTAQFAPVTQESVTAYEAGVKITALDRTLQLNAAGFHYDYKNKQVRGIILDPIFNQLEKLVNIPKSRINGVELEIIYTPVHGLTLHGGATYIDSKVQKFSGINNNRITDDYAGSALPFSPKWYLVGDINYEFAINDNLHAFLGANALYNSKANSTLIANDSNLAELSRIKAFTTVDLRAGIKAADDRWAFSIWGRNITNSYYWSNQFVTQDVVVRYAAKPVTYGATLKFNFR
jgi:outer membrane receptor protein involved in Fe transport